MQGVAFTGEMALLVEGLDVGVEPSIEEYIVEPGEPGGENGSFVARPSTLGHVSQHGSMVDPLVKIFGSVHEKLPEQGSMRSALFPNFGSMFSTADPHAHVDHSDEEGQQRDEDDDLAGSAGEDMDDSLQAPLLSHQGTTWEKDMVHPISHGSVLSMGRRGSLILGTGETISSADIGGGWQMAYQIDEKEGPDGKKTKEFKRIYLHQEGGRASVRGSLVSIAGGDIHGEGDYAQTAAIISTPALCSKALLDQHPVGPAMVHPAETASQVPSWKALLEPGVKRALIVGIGIQILQQVRKPILPFHFSFLFFLFGWIRRNFVKIEIY